MDLGNDWRDVNGKIVRRRGENISMLSSALYVWHHLVYVMPINIINDSSKSNSIVYFKNSLSG